MLDFFKIYDTISLVDAAKSIILFTEIMHEQYLKIGQTMVFALFYIKNFISVTEYNRSIDNTL